jgi:hypothetical protein
VFYKAVLTQDVTISVILHIFIVLWIFHPFLTLFNTSFVFIVRKIHWSYLKYTSLRAPWYRCNSRPLLCVKLHNSSHLIISPLNSSSQQYAAVLSQFTALCIRMCAGHHSSQVSKEEKSLAHGSLLLGPRTACGLRPIL